MEFPTSQPTREDARIEENRERMGVIFFRKEGESLGLSSGSIVKLKGSKLIRKCEKIKCCLLTSDKYLPVTSGIGEGDYFFEYWSSDLKTVKKLSLREVAQSDVFYHPSAGLALIPVCPSWASKLRLKSSVLDERRTFPTSYHSGGGESVNINKYCYIVRRSGSCGCKKESLTVERFTLITNRDYQGQVQYRLQDESETIFRNHDEIIAKWSNLYPHGAVILENEGPQPTCIGILNFTEEGLISPVFFTPETFTGKVQLYYPTAVEEEASSVAIRFSEGKIEPNTNQIDSALYSQEAPCSATAPLQAPCPIVTSNESQSQIFSSAGAENQDGASLTNDDQIDDCMYFLKKWQKLYEKVQDENTKLKQQSEHDQEVISLLKDGNAKKNEELRAENEDLRKGNDDLRSKIEELHTRYKQLREDRDAESIMSCEDRSALLTENEQLKTKIKALHDRNMKLLAENSELRKDWNAESEELLEVNEGLRAQNNKLKTKNKELLAENEELSARHRDVFDKLKELLNQSDSAACGDDTSNIKDSNNVKAEEPSGPSANSPQGDADGSRKEEEPFLDPLSKVVSKLD